MARWLKELSVKLKMSQQVVAKSNHIRQTPRKVRLVADQIRGLPANEAMVLLQALNKRAARPLFLTLKQAIGNAKNNFNLKEDGLRIKSLEVGKGPTLKRGRAVSRGRWHSILKRSSHLTLVLEGEEKESKSQKLKKDNHGTKS